MQLKSITIEGMHSMHSKTFNFNNVNYLYGMNGVGKSTVLQAIQLALLGYIPGTNKTKEGIFRHANGHTMAVTAILEDNNTSVTIRRIWAGTPPKTISSVEISPENYDIKSIIAELELPIFNFNEFIGMTANKLKDWFISFLPGNATAVCWDKVLSDAVTGLDIADSELLPSIVAYANELDAVGVEGVRNMNQYMKSLLSQKESELKRTQHTIQSLIFYDDEDIAGLTAEELQLKLQDLNAIKDAAMNQQVIESQRRDILNRMAGLRTTSENYTDDPEYQCSASYCKTIQAEIVNTELQRYTISDKKATIDAAINIRKNVISGKGVCPFTNTNCDSIGDLIEQYSVEVSELVNEKVLLTEKLSELDSKIAKLKQDLSGHEQRRREIEKQYAEHANLTQRLNQLPTASEITVDVDHINEEIQVVMDNMVKVQANDRYTNLIDILTSDKYKLEQSIIALKTWIKLTDANGLQTSMMQAPFEQLAGQMDDYISKLFGSDVSAKFYLSSKANSFSFGINRRGAYIPYDLLSSGEKCMFTLALMLCIVQNSKSSLKLIMIDDLLDHLDDDNIISLFDSLYDIQDIQLIFAGVKPYTSCNTNEIVIEVN